MPLPVYSTSYRQSTHLDWSEVLTCRRCGHSAKVHVASAGSGHGRAVYGIGKEAAQARAGTAAFERALDEGKAIVRLARCPRCRQRYQGVGWHAFQVACVFAFLATLVNLIAQFMLDASEASVPLCRVTGFLIYVIALWLGVVAHKRKLARADRTVRFEAR